MRKRTWIWILAVVVVCVCGAGAAVWLSRSRQPEPQSAARLIPQGNRLLSAIIAYKVSHGLLPQDLSDVLAGSPELAKEFAGVPGEKSVKLTSQIETLGPWQYEWLGGCGFTLSCTIIERNRPNSFAACSICRAPGDHESEPAWPKDCPFTQPEILTPLPDRQREATIAEYRKRIAAEPDWSRHYAGFLSYLVHEKRFDEAKTVADDLVRRIPGYWWGHFAQMDLRSRVGEIKPAEEEFLKWLKDSGTFSDCCCAFIYWNGKREVRQALAALGVMATKTPEAPYDYLATDVTLSGDLSNKSLMLDAVWYASAARRPKLADQLFAMTRKIAPELAGVTLDRTHRPKTPVRVNLYVDYW